MPIRLPNADGVSPFWMGAFLQAESLLPGVLDVSRAELHACARPVSADDVPLIGRLSQAPRLVPPLLALASGASNDGVPTNVWVNVGHGSKGWTLACGSSELLARVMTTSSPAVDAVPLAADYSPRRF
jgi:D-amino-acid dehydrogenase